MQYIGEYMIIEERLNGGHVFSYNTETKLMYIDEFNPEKNFKIDINGIKTLQNMFKMLDDNKLL